MSLQIYDPTTGASGRNVKFAARPQSLAGLRIGLVVIPIAAGIVSLASRSRAAHG